MGRVAQYIRGRSASRRRIGGRKRLQPSPPTGAGERRQRDRSIQTAVSCRTGRSDRRCSSPRRTRLRAGSPQRRLERTRVDHQASARPPLHGAEMQPPAADNEVSSCDQNRYASTRLISFQRTVPSEIRGVAAPCFGRSCTGRREWASRRAVWRPISNTTAPMTATAIRVISELEGSCSNQGGWGIC